MAVGLIFLLDEGDQRRLLANVARVLEPAGRFLFSAPRETCRWSDTLTGRPSVSLGEDAYAAHLAGAGLTPADRHSDEGGNNCHEAVRPARADVAGH